MTRRRPTRVLQAVLGAAVAAGAACAPVPTAPAPAPEAPPAEVRFDAVALPPGTHPQVLAAAGDALLVGVRHDGPPARPGLLRRAADGTVTEVPLDPATPYGGTASWYALAAAGDRVLGVGGDRGGAHGNVRWSVWTGSPTGVQEQAQAFSTFGGWGAGELVGAVLTPRDAVVVGSWQSADAGLDVAVWRTDGTGWSRGDSTGTALASSRSALGFPTSATDHEEGVVITGWRFGNRHPGPVPVVWRSGAEPGGWTETALPDAGRSGAALAARCAGPSCAVAGRVDGTLALWRLADRRWTRVAGLPGIPVGDDQRLAPPLDPAGRPWQVVSDGGRVVVVDAGGPAPAVRTAVGPTGAVLAAAAAGSSAYVVTDGPDGPRLWRTDR
jgi:hypothetical protein